MIRFLMLVLCGFVMPINVFASSLYSQLIKSQPPHVMEKILNDAYFDVTTSVRCNAIEAAFLKRLYSGSSADPYLLDNLSELARNLCGSYEVTDDIDKFVSKYYIESCKGITNRSKEEFINHCLKTDVFCRLGYNMADGLKLLVDTVAKDERDDEFYLCVLSAVASQKFDSVQKKIDLLDYGLERARYYNNVSFENMINQLKQEIDKLNQND